MSEDDRDANRESDLMLFALHIASNTSWINELNMALHLQKLKNKRVKSLDLEDSFEK